MSVLLSKPQFQGITQKELAQQLTGAKKAEEKLPTWFNSEGIYYPTSVQLEQTSSEETAAYKARLVEGKWMADLTGGFGVDTYFFSRKIPNMVHCEWDRELHEIVLHNAIALNCTQVDFRCVDGIQFLRETSRRFDWIYLDPGRRDASRNKVFLLSDCQPDVTLHLDLLLEKSSRIMVKTSPLLDISSGIEQLKHVKEIHVVAVGNEVKELLWILERDAPPKEIMIKTVNLKKSGEESFDFLREGEKNSTCTFSKPLEFLYEPNGAILKAGGFKSLCAAFEVYKIQEHSHLYTSEKQIGFPGRAFRVKQVFPFNKKELSSLKGKKANVSTRNFTLPVAEIRKRFAIRDGGDVYLFFTTNKDGERIVIQCSRISSKDTAI